MTHKYFDPFIMSLIFISTILMAVDSPLNDPDSTLSQVLNIIDIVITSFFVMESVTKIIAYGFIFNGPESYLRISWNIMDFIIVIFSVSYLLFFCQAQRCASLTSIYNIAHINHFQQSQNRFHQGYSYAKSSPSSSHDLPK